MLHIICKGYLIGSVAKFMMIEPVNTLPFSGLIQFNLLDTHI